MPTAPRWFPYWKHAWIRAVTYLLALAVVFYGAAVIFGEEPAAQVAAWIIGVFIAGYLCFDMARSASRKE